MVIKYVIIKLSDWLAKLQTYFIVTLGEQFNMFNCLYNPFTISAIITYISIISRERKGKFTYR